MSYVIEQGEVVEVLRGFRDCSFDALLCDPPYGFSFMGKAWDYDVPSVDLWRECLRVLKPGAPLVAFGGSRTYHRLACGVEDAGFELRDCMMWLHGTGFPKSQNIGLALDKSAGAVREVIGTRVYGDGHVQNSSVSIGFNGCDPNADQRKITAPATELAQQWDGYGTALKPAHEPIVLARKPLEGTMAANVARYGVGGLNIDGCRIEGEGAGTKCNNRDAHGRCLGHRNAGRSTSGETFHGVDTEPDGRWPANLILSHDEGCRPTGATRPVKNGTAVKHRGVVAGTGASFGIAKPVGTPDAGYGVQEVEVWECTPDCPIGMLDASVAPTTSVPYSGGPSRFFYCAKVSTKEREAGCDHLVKRTAGEATERADLNIEGEHAAGLDNPRVGAGRTGGARNHHPTLKPLSLTTWLARLIMPPVQSGRAAPVILVPFAGAGSEMIGCLKAGWPAVFGIEREAEYIEIARARLKHWCPEGRT